MVSNPFPPPPGCAVPSNCYWLDRTRVVDQIHNGLDTALKEKPVGVLSVNGLPGIGKSQVLKQWISQKLIQEKQSTEPNDVYASISMLDVFDGQRRTASSAEAFYCQRLNQYLASELLKNPALRTTTIDLASSASDLERQIACALVGKRVFIVIRRFDHLFKVLARKEITGVNFLESVFALVYGRNRVVSSSQDTVVAIIIEDRLSLIERLKLDYWSSDLKSTVDELATHRPTEVLSEDISDGIALLPSEVQQFALGGDSQENLRLRWTRPESVFKRLHWLTNGHVGLTSWLCWTIHEAQFGKNDSLFLPEELGGDRAVMDLLLPSLRIFWEEYRLALGLTEVEIGTLRDVALKCGVWRDTTNLALGYNPYIRTLLDRRALVPGESHPNSFRLAIPLIGLVLLEE